MLSNLSRLIKSAFNFPNPVNEYAARMVAGMVLVLCLTIILTNESWLTFVLVYGFLARVTTGPLLSPMGLLATRVLAPVLNLKKPVPGPPKRFAQAVGLIFSVTALVLYFPLDFSIAAKGVLAILSIFAFLESAIGFCAGCFVFNYLMKWGIIPESVCRECTVKYSDLTN